MTLVLYKQVMGRRDETWLQSEPASWWHSQVSDGADCTDD